MSDHYILDADGNPKAVDLITWALWFETSMPARILRRTQVGPYWVSTVFLGTDHNFRGRGLPVLWETMVFKGRIGERSEGGLADLDCRRYDSKESALIGHQTTCQLVALTVEQESGTMPALVEIEKGV